MKKLLVLLFVVLSVASLHAQLLLTEDFNYGSTTDSLTNPAIGGSVWKRHSGTGGPIQYLTSSLTYSGYAGGSATGGSVSFSNNTSSREDANIPFAAATAGNVYASFLLNITASGGTTGDYVIHLNDSQGNGISSTFRPKLWIRDGSATGKAQIGLSKGAAATSAVWSADLNLNTTYLVVMKYTIVSGATNDSSSLFIFSSGIPSTEPAATLVATDITQSDLTRVRSFCIRQGTVGTSNAIIDGLRVGTNWSDIASGGTTPPAAPSPVTGFTFTGSTATASLGWTKPSGYDSATMSILVFMKASSAVTAGTPSLAPSRYTANSNFSAASNVYQNDAGAKSVYNGDGSGLTVTGLAAGTSYYLLVYVVRDADSSYSTGTLGSGSTSGPVTALTFSATGQNTATISWTRPAGYNFTNQNTLVFVKSGSAITAGTPTLGYGQYTANSDFSMASTAYQNDAAAKTVYNGDSASVSISGLSSSTTYYVLVYTVNLADSAYSPSATTNGITQSSTPPPSPLQSLTTPAATSTSVTLAWQLPVGYASATHSVIVYLKKGSAIGSGANSRPVSAIVADSAFSSGLATRYPNDTAARAVYKGDLTGITVTGLDPASSYQATAFVVRDADSSYSTAMSAGRNTLNAQPNPIAGITIAPQLSTTATFSITAPTGYNAATSSMLIFVKADTTISTGTPSRSAAHYIPTSTVFGSGLGFENDALAKTVSNGDLLSFTVTNLVAGKKYYVAAYALTDADSVYSSVYLTSFIQNVSTPQAVSNTTVTPLTGTTARVSWTKPGTYNNNLLTTMVFVKADTAVITGTPTKAPGFYTANANVTLGTAYQNDPAAKCVYKGDTNFVNISGLVPFKTYFVMVVTVEDGDSVYSPADHGFGTGAPLPSRSNIGAISSVNSSTGVPDSLNKYVMTTGIVYGYNQRATGLQFVLRDNTGGITVFHTAKNYGYTVHEGDSIMTVGTVATFRGLAELSNIDTLIVLATGKPLKTPTVVNKVTESGENDLLHINSVRFVTAPAGSTWPSASSNISVINHAGDTTVLRVLALSGLAGQPLPTTPWFSVTGLGVQFSSSSAAPFAFDGYQLFPRTAADIMNELDTLGHFTLVAPANNTTISLSGDSGATVQFSWTSVQSTVVGLSPFYTVSFDTLNGTFSPGIAVTPSDASGADTTLTATKGEIASMLGLNPGESVTLKWRVSALAGTYQRMADTTFTVTFSRGIFNGINTVNAASTMSVYPNPASGSLFIKAQTRINKVEVLNITGQSIMSQKGESNEMSLNTESLANGVYLVKIEAANGTAVKRLVIKH